MFKEYSIKAEGIKSLCWHNDELVDWVNSGKRYTLDGKVIDGVNVAYSYPFDAAIISPSGNYSVVYTRNQTKGLLLKNGKILREINRSHYQAHEYDYPIAFSILENGQEVLIHCPNDYDRLDIEEIESGKILTNMSDREGAGLFHSRLTISPNGRTLLSAGWLWQPIDVIGLFDISASISDPTKLDTLMLSWPGQWELSSAAFLDDTHIFVSSSDYFLGDEDEPEYEQPGEFKIALWSLDTDTYESIISCGSPVGELLPINKQYVVSFYEHPKLWDMNSGKMLHEWTEINSPENQGSITQGEIFPPFAIDLKNNRFAIADNSKINIVEFNI